MLPARGVLALQAELIEAFDGIGRFLTSDIPFKLLPWKEEKTKNKKPKARSLACHSLLISKKVPNARSLQFVNPFPLGWDMPRHSVDNWRNYNFPNIAQKRNFLAKLGGFPLVPCSEGRIRPCRKKRRRGRIELVASLLPVPVRDLGSPASSVVDPKTGSSYPSCVWLACVVLLPCTVMALEVDRGRAGQGLE